MKRKRIVKTCMYCNFEFLAGSNNAKYCPSCRLVRKSQTSKESRKKRKLMKSANEFKSAKTITEILKEIKAYNKANDTVHMK